MSIRAIFLGLSLLATPVLADQDTAANFPDDLSETLKDTFCRAQFTIIGDTNHDAHEIPEFIGSDTVFEAMKACNVKHVFNEAPPKAQALYDLLINEKITSDEFVDKMKQAGYGQRGDAVLYAHADVALQAQEHEMQYYAVLMPTGAASITSVDFFTTLGLKAYRDLLPENMVEDYNAFIFESKVISEERKLEIFAVIHAQKDDPIFIAAQKFFKMADEAKTDPNDIENKRENDALLYDYVLPRVKDGERAVIIIGDGHPSAPEIGIYDRLGADNASWIRIIDQVTRFTRQDNRPDLIINLDQQSVFQP